MRLLIVAPNVGLQAVQEVLAAVEGSQATVLHGTVSAREVLNRIATGGYQVVHFATHGDRHVLQASDGLVPDDLLEQALRASGSVQLVVLNACASVHTAAQIYHAGVPQVIAWRDAVEDRVAGWWAGIFYRHLSLSHEPWEAYHGAVEALQKHHPGQEIPIWLNGRLAQLEREVAALRRGLAVPAWVAAAQAIGWLVLLVTLALLASAVVRG
jgi:CHAT domain-containing protein